MRKCDKEKLMAKIAAGEAYCDCGRRATHPDAAGREECDECQRLNHQAEQFHERYEREVKHQNPDYEVYLPDSYPLFALSKPG